MTEVVQALGLTKRIWGTTIVQDVSFGVRAGEVVGFLGPNGAGKTTTIRMLLGLSRPTRGSANVSGSRVPSATLQRVGSMVDGPGLYPWASGGGNLRLLAPGLPAGEREEALARVGLHGVGRKRVRAYSQGMRQRLALAVAIANGPDALVLDEPMNGLDPAGMKDFRSMIRSLSDAGRAVLVSSHLLDEVQRLCDRVVILDRGQVVDAIALAGSLVTHRVSLRPQDLAAARAALTAAGLSSEVSEGGPATALAVRAGSAMDVAEPLRAAGIWPDAIEASASTLEPRFLELTDQERP
jgi:ABC-2 type transport system ATP-binding protein